jgi:small-conductance mechanosensitive channel
MDLAAKVEGMSQAESFQMLGMHLTDLIVPWMAILISIAAAFWFKEFAQNLVAGMSFKWGGNFREGDQVILDGHDAMIIKIGMKETVFGRYTENGYTWQYVPNEKLEFHKLEKIVHRDLHLDTDIEKGQQIMELMAKAQSAYKKPLEVPKDAKGQNPLSE